MPTRNAYSIWRGVGGRRSPVAGVGRAIACLAALASCTSRTEQADRQYEMFKRSSESASELCARGRAVRDVYLSAGDEQKYRERSVSLAIDCQQAELNEQLGIWRSPDGTIIEADNMEDTAAPNEAVSLEAVPIGNAVKDPCFNAGPRC